MVNTILYYFSDPLWIGLSLVLLAWIWEDASLISGALLAADQHIPPVYAAVAVFIGIFTGDLALYFIGIAAHRWRRLRAWTMMRPQFRRFQYRFKLKTFSNILLVRFIPGLRTVGFLLCGFCRVPLYKFISIMAFAGAVWIALIFTGVYQLGSAQWFESSPLKWLVGGVALLLLFFSNRFALKSAR